jgi:hypothetical protein
LRVKILPYVQNAAEAGSLKILGQS